MISGLTTEITNHEGLVTEWYRTVMGLGFSVFEGLKDRAR